MKTTLTIITIIAFTFMPFVSRAQDQSENDTETEIQLTEEDLQQLEQYRVYADSVESAMNYKYGKISLDGGLAVIDVPEGYKFLEKEQANYIMSDVWGNPEDASTLGLLIKEDESPIDATYAIEISYSEEGYIEDEDAEDLDYDDLLEEMQEDAIANNIELEKLGYPTANLVGWAAPPFYDKENHKLHWAKELKFDGYDTNTLNYNIRVLGRKGFITLNVIGDMSVLSDVQQNIDPILTSTTFNAGNQYSDFNPDIDEVAAYGIGGLIAGKVLAKAGFFALIAKFWKFIAIGAIAVFGGLRKKIFGSKEA
ncbi:DUF2167 domain-containing protein [Dokdonia sp.]|uniref:DUF2167 domain-containing protein n=1 Tax=Dokdonia sp. TaxID=2024995 RepID=UPI00326505BE